MDEMVPRPLPRVEFLRVTAAQLLHLGQDAAFNYMAGDPLHPVSVWLVDGEQIHPWLLRPLELIGERSMRAGTRRAAPGKPWGDLRIARANIGLNEMEWTIGPTGYYIPVPWGWISDKLARRLSDEGTTALRWEIPPQTNTTFWL